MKTIKNITDKKAFWVGVFTLIILALSISIIHADDNRFRGYIEQSYFPLNDEHGIYAETTINVEKPITQFYGKEVFGFTVLSISWAHGIKKPTREEKRITSYGTGFAYMNNFDAGIGIKLSKQWEAKLIYRAHRMPDGYEGDWSGISVKYTFGAK